LADVSDAVASGTQYSYPQAALSLDAAAISHP
jgi:hypothetical protein